MTIAAETIADSLSPAGHRLTSQVLRFPRTTGDEVLMHRAFARNARSSRATPVRFMIEEAEQRPYIPVKWQYANPGMQGGDELTVEEAEVATREWLLARDDAVRHANVLLHAVGLHKTVPNRLLEPFTYQTMIVSGTDEAWRNFFEQRCSNLADPPMELLADAMLAAYADSRPVEVGYNGWHLPFITADERAHWDITTLVRVSVARCARISNTTFDGRHDIDADLGVYSKLTTAAPPHHSPLEHPAQAAGSLDAVIGCFVGWCQLRHLPNFR